MKIAFAGKGGVGKTTLAAIFIRLLSEDSRRVFAVDADPNTNLARTLGFSKPNDIKPIVEMKDLIYDRMEIKGEAPGAFYKLNPRIDDIPKKFVQKKDNINLIVMGTVNAGGSGCVCPESTFLKELLKHIVLNEEEDIVMDMEAGIEHLGRSTAIAMDRLVIVAEPTLTSIETAGRINKLAQDLKMKTSFIGNKLKGKDDENFLNKNLGREDILGMVPYYDYFRELDRGSGIMNLNLEDKVLLPMKEIRTKLQRSIERKASGEKKITR